MKHHKLIKHYKLVDAYEVEQHSANGYKPVGGVSFNLNGKPYQAMALYQDVLLDQSLEHKGKDTE